MDITQRRRQRHYRHFARHSMRIGDWARRHAGPDKMNALLDRDPRRADRHRSLCGGRSDGVLRRYQRVFLHRSGSPPRGLSGGIPAQLQLFYRQDPLQRLRRLQAEHPDDRAAGDDDLTAECRYMASTANMPIIAASFWPETSGVTAGSTTRSRPARTCRHLRRYRDSGQAMRRSSTRSTKDTDCPFVDRFMATPMFYPANYGFIRHPGRRRRSAGRAGGDPIRSLPVR